MLGAMRGQVNESRGVGGISKRVVGEKSPLRSLILTKATKPSLREHGWNDREDPPSFAGNAKEWGMRLAAR